jgi:hypothetical protein
VAALRQPEPLRAAVEIVRDPRVVAIDEDSGIVRLDLQADSARVVVLIPPVSVAAIPVVGIAVVVGKAVSVKAAVQVEARVVVAAIVATVVTAGVAPFPWTVPLCCHV